MCVIAKLTGFASAAGALVWKIDRVKKTIGIVNIAYSLKPPSVFGQFQPDGVIGSDQTTTRKLIGSA
jgi:hypothetical protein